MTAPQFVSEKLQQRISTKPRRFDCSRCFSPKFNPSVMTLLLKNLINHRFLSFGQFFTGLSFFFFFFFLYLGLLSQPFTNHRTAGEGGGHFFNFLLPLPLASQTLRHQLGNYCRELTSTHMQQPDSNREPLASEHKSLTTSLVVWFLELDIQLVLRLIF